MIAAAKGHLEACKLLIEAGADASLADETGILAADQAERNGHASVAAYLKGFGLTEVAPTELSFGIEPDEPDDHAWEEESVPTTPDWDHGAHLAVQSQQRLISAHVGDFGDENWGDVPIVLPGKGEVASTPKALPEEVAKEVEFVLRDAVRAGVLDLTFLRQKRDWEDDPRLVELLPLLARVASDLGVQVVEIGSPYWNDFELEPAAPSSSEGELVVCALDQIESSLFRCIDSIAAIEAECGRIVPLDRFEEETLFTAIHRADDEVALAISTSAAALTFLNAHFELVRSGDVSLSAFTELEFESDEGDEDEEEDLARGTVGSDEDEAVFEPPVKNSADLAGVKLPNKLVGTIDEISRFAREVDPGSPGRNRHLASLIKTLSLAEPFYEELMSALSSSGEGGPVKEIRARRAAAMRSRERIVVAHLPHVTRLAFRLQGRGVEVSDLVQEGMLGLFRAVELFDHKRGVRFQSYAMYWARQAMTRAIDNYSRTIRLPVHIIETINKMKHARRELLEETGREGTVEELAEHLTMPVQKIRKILNIADEPINLETPIDEEQNSCLCDFIEDKSAVIPLDAAIERDLKETVSQVLTSLTPREERVIRMRFGMVTNTDHTLEEVGKQFDVTRERIRQIEAKALKKFRHPSRSRRMRSFLDQ